MLGGMARGAGEMPGEILWQGAAPTYFQTGLGEAGQRYGKIKFFVETEADKKSMRNQTREQFLQCRGQGDVSRLKQCQFPHQPWAQGDRLVGHDYTWTVTS